MNKKINRTGLAFAAAAAAFLCGFWRPVSAQEWWTRPWDHRVQTMERPEPEFKQHTMSVNDLGGSSEADNRRDIAKSLGRIRKFREQTMFRVLEQRSIADAAAMGKSAAEKAMADAAGKIDAAETIVRQALALQKDDKPQEAREQLSAALPLLAVGETIAETYIAVRQDRKHIRHLRNVIALTGMDDLTPRVDALEKSLEQDASERVGNLKAACDTLRAALDALAARIESLPMEENYRAEFREYIDVCDYLLKSAVKDGPRQETYQGDLVMRDQELSDLTLGSVSSVARRVGQLRFHLRRLSNLVSAAAKQPATEAVGDAVSARRGFPVDDLDEFTRSKFGWVKANRLIANEVWDWEFNYTPRDADAVSIAGRWLFRIDPEFKGHDEEWFKAGFDADGWGNIYAPNWWEREGVLYFNSLDNLLDSFKRVYGREFDSDGRSHGRKNLSHRQYNGAAWYGKQVFIPEEWAGSDLLLRGGVLNSVFRFYVNGALADEKWQRGGWGLKDLTIPSAAVRFGEINQFVVCCFNDASVGGLAEGPLWLVKSGGTADFRRTPFGGGFVSEEQYGAAAGPFNANLVMGAMSPGAILASDASELSFWGWTMKGYAAPQSAVFMGEHGPQSKKLDAAGEIVKGVDMRANWLLLAPGQGYGNPLLFVFEKRPVSISWAAEPMREGLDIAFAGPAGQVAIAHPGRNGDSEETLLKSAAIWSRALLAYPESASEIWSVDPARKNTLPFEIMGRFELLYNYHRISDAWGTAPLETAALPVLASYALDYGYPGFAECDAAKSGAPINYQAYAKGEFRARLDADRLIYETPCADHAALWKGIGTFTEGEVLKNDREGNPKKYWSVAETKKWGSNNNRLALHIWSQPRDGVERWWDLGFQYSFNGDILPPDHENWKRFDAIVKDHEENDLLLILDAFPDDLGTRPGDKTPPPCGFWMREHPDVIPSQAKLWKYIAERYKNVSPRHFAYNFYNEPAYIDPETYNKAIKAYTAAIREVETGKWITHDMGDGWAQPNWMFGTEPTGDPRTIYQYHFYYQHDGVNGEPEHFYPRWDKGKPFWHSYSRECFTAEILDTLVYQTINRAPVWWGEFGASVNNPNQEALIWFLEQVELVERMGQGWSLWNWDGNSYRRTGLRGGDYVSPAVPILRRFMRRKGAF